MNETMDATEKKMKLLELPTTGERILKYLSARDLSSCAKICNSWNIIAGRILKERNTIIIIPKYEDLIESLQDLWSKPRVAILFRPSRHHKEMKNSLYGMLMHGLVPWNHNQRSSLSDQYLESVKEAQKQTKRLWDYLPTNCAMVHFAPKDWNDLRRSRDDTHFPSPVLILIPSIEGIEIQPFGFCHHINLTFEALREHKPLFISGEDNCSLKNNAKFMLVFLTLLDARNLGTLDTYRESAVGNYIDEDTVIIAGHNDNFSLNTGMAFSGERVRVECFPTETSKCCVRSGFELLENLGFGNESGIAFVALKYLSPYPPLLEEMWSKSFPNISLIGNFNFYPFISVIPRTINLQGQCNKCSTPINVYDFKEKPVLIVFILFQNVVCKTINT